MVNARFRVGPTGASVLLVLALWLGLHSSVGSAATPITFPGTVAYQSYSYNINLRAASADALCAILSPNGRWVPSAAGSFTGQCVNASGNGPINTVGPVFGCPTGSTSGSNGLCTGNAPPPEVRCSRGVAAAPPIAPVVTTEVFARTFHFHTYSYYVNVDAPTGQEACALAAPGSTFVPNGTTYPITGPCMIGTSAANTAGQVMDACPAGSQVYSNSECYRGPTVTCPAGYLTTPEYCSKPGFAAPDYCPSGYVRVLGTSTCVRSCPAGQSWDEAGAKCVSVPPCEDGDLCTTDACNPDAGGCFHTALSCDDGMACTTDSCNPDAGCAHAVDAGACVCTAGTPVTVPVGGSKELSLWGGSCPAGLGGTFGAKLTLSAAGTSAQEACSNGCTSAGVLQGSAAVDVNLCSGSKVTVTATGKYALEKKFNPECSPSTCGSGCGAGHCRTDEASGSLSVAQSRFQGMDWKEPFPGGRVFVKCGGTLSGSAEVGGGLKHVTSVGAAAGTCAECQAGSMSVTGGVGAAFNCSTGVEYMSVVEEVGCQKCLSGEVKLTGSRQGSCTSPTCYGFTAAGKVAGAMPAVKMGFLWWSVTGACGLTTEGCSEVNTCGSCACGAGSCSELTNKLSCSVCYGNSALPVCMRTP